MSTLKIDQPTTLVVKSARTRTATKPIAANGPSFGSVLRTGANTLLRGVETAAGVVGGPLVSGAVRTARIGVGLDDGGVAGGEDGTFSELRALQEQAQSFNLQYLALQEELQQENRRFTALSNTAKALHDTNKAILQNIRS